MRPFTAQLIGRTVKGIGGGTIVGSFTLLGLALLEAVTTHNGFEEPLSLGKPEYLSWQLGGLWAVTFALSPLPRRWPWLWALLRGLPAPITWLMLVSAQEGMSSLHRAVPAIFETLFVVPMVLAGVPLWLWQSLATRDTDAVINEP